MFTPAAPDGTFRANRVSEKGARDRDVAYRDLWSWWPRDPAARARKIRLPGSHPSLQGPAGGEGAAGRVK